MPLFLDKDETELRAPTEGRGEKRRRITDKAFAGMALYPDYDK